MTAEPILEMVARLIAKHRLEVVLIGNAAAALQGSPVTTLDLDFMFRKTEGNLRKLRRLADDMEACCCARTTRRQGSIAWYLQLDFMAKIDGIRSFEALRGRAAAARFGGYELRVAAARARKRERGTPLRRESDRAVVEQIHRPLARPMEKRTNFLRRRRPGGGSSL